MRRRNQRGSAALESAIVAVPMLFTALCGIELARCMWMYHTLAAATKTAVRYATVHGGACVSVNENCAATVGSVSSVLRRSAVGLDGNQVTLNFTAGSESLECVSLVVCEASASNWPPASHNVAGHSVSIRARYNFISVLRSLWPGQAQGVIRLQAQATEAIQF